MNKRRQVKACPFYVIYLTDNYGMAGIESTTGLIITCQDTFCNWRD
jgi:hypothetical protein